MTELYEPDEWEEQLWEEHAEVKRSLFGFYSQHMDQEAFNLALSRILPGELLFRFHMAFEHPYNEANFPPEDEKQEKILKLRTKLIKEERKELDQALASNDPENLLKECCDLVYVVVGLCTVMGWDFDGAFKEVHRSNMSKLGENGLPIYREDGKILKGPNYSPADMSSFII